MFKIALTLFCCPLAIGLAFFNQLSTQFASFQKWFRTDFKILLIPFKEQQHFFLFSQFIQNPNRRQEQRCLSLVCAFSMSLDSHPMRAVLHTQLKWWGEGLPSETHPKIANTPYLHQGSRLTVSGRPRDDRKCVEGDQRRWSKRK